MSSSSPSPLLSLGAATAVEPAATSRRERDVAATITRLARWLPEQRPLSVFVHQNPLGAVEDQPFHAACEAATRLRHVRTTRTATRYRELMAERHIRPEDVAAAKQRIASMRLPHLDELPTPAPGTVLLSRVRPEIAEEVSEMVDAFLLRVMPPFLDLGSALWPMPHRDEGFRSVVARLSRSVVGVPEPWLGGLWKTLDTNGGTALARLVSLLDERGDPTTGWPSLVAEGLFALPGYAGMFHRLEHHPDEAPPGVLVRLEDYVVVRLAVEAHALVEVARRLFGRRASIATLAAHLRVSPPSVHHPGPVWTEELGAFQDAFEEDYVRSFVGAMVMSRDVARPAPPPVRAHFLCCIDDRCESLRRHIEEVLPDVETVGSAGFFGVAVKHRAPLSVDENASCPAPVVPEKRVTEALPEREAARLGRRRRLERAWATLAGDDASRGALRGALASFANLARAPRTMFEMLAPELFVRPPTEFEGTELVCDAAVDPQGFSLEDRAGAVRRNLENVGLLRGFGRWVFVVGHGSLSVNNAFRSGYQCGACGGRRGGLNARLFVTFANEPAVRAALRAGGLDIPDETLFVAGEHDTALDHLRLFDLERVPAERREELEALRRGLDVALERNAKERARRFDDVPLEASLEDTLARVRRRCGDFAETRPEYNHATNAACVIGRRALTKGLFLDRRAFLVSYDPSTDDERSSTLERLVSAPLMVCAGISLEYFFATMDPARFGAGTKLPHNVQGLLGVSNGADGDLRPGLWAQTTEIHEPVRLVTVVEAEPEDLTRVLSRLPAVKACADNGWIHLFACSPSDRGFFRWVDRRFEPYAALPHALYEVPTSLAACGHTRGPVAPCLIVPAAALPAGRGEEEGP